MGTQAQVAQLQQEPHQVPHWSLSSRVAFRFCLVYFGLYCLLTQIAGGFLPLPNLETPDPSTLWPTRQIVTWTATHVFRVTHPLVYFSGSGDKTFDWVLAFCLLVVAAVATIVWSILDRQRLNYVTLHKWFRLFLTFCSGRADAGLRHGESRSPANAFPISHEVAGAIRQLLAHGSPVVLRGRGAGL
jgi:hypothetical protein